MRYVLKEADEKAKAEAALNETSDDLRPINDSDPDPEVTFLNDSKFINESELKICSSCEYDNAAKFASASAFSLASFKTMEGQFLCYVNIR